jgi:hypothetical protein
MNYTEAQIIRKGYQYERAPNYNTAREINDWLKRATNRNPESKTEIVRLFNIGRAEGRAR